MELNPNHPATQAAGACVIIGPGVTRYFDLGTHTIVQSPTADGAWQPSAASDAMPVTPRKDTSNA